MRICLHCNNEIAGHAVKYCSNKCQADYQLAQYVSRWKDGLESGKRGILAQNISHHIVRYLTEKYGQHCSLCGWGKVNPITNKVPLEIDHIDGDADNNIETNLRLLCPNCHSLTPNYRNLNKGKGRAWRRDKYVKISDVPL